MKKILVVYNCCGIARDNIDMWLNHIQRIITQDYNNFDLCISGCKISDRSKEVFRKLQKNSNINIYLSFIEDVLPVNITFNKTCMAMSELNDYDAFLYIASDVDMNGDNSVISKLSDLHFSKNSAITSAVVNFDSGIEVWLGSHIFNEYLNTSHYQVPVGKTLNLHCMMFDKRIYDEYNERIIPDIFRTYCTESVFFYLTASLNMKYMIHDKSLFIIHLAGRDGSSIGFQGGRDWRDMFNTSKSVHERIMTAEAKSVGFGYEEYIGIFPHDPSYYNSDYTHKNPKILLDFTKENLYLKDYEFSYKNINFQLEVK